ncbi:MAG: glyoxalase [Lysobacterales bacterium CG17_big_fil_post_rev_8_21_14_2_50_64_11]|nr:MAG: glyoxalase [Xanthomonadales bacterium CG17_big_fil_post_rev_8_21_14_2_50_64_11]PIX59699.1 MAG: glyoxalase [Xanthomonadales bacterium CG_4_10_14_3_um_filter_64_11]
MIGYTTIGTNDLPRAAKFYDALLAELGGKRVLEFERGILWGNSANGASLGVLKPFDGQAAEPGNGPMVALAADSREKVDQVYKRALELGATDEGPAGPRGDNFYGGYFRDLDGNKLAVFIMG